MPKLTSAQRASRGPLEISTTTPPTTLSATQSIARVLKAVGNNNFTVTLPSNSSSTTTQNTTTTTPSTQTPSCSQTQTQTPSSHPKNPLLVTLPPHFRNTIWLRNGGYVVIDTAGPNVERGHKLDGEIINVVREEKEWRKMAYWPAEFAKRRREESDEEGKGSSGEEGEEGRNPNRRVGEMPPSDDDEEEEE
ncbi:hypothetical protein FKW77_006024 [Venturia effusa]|uniref:Uncharacterized protein n=1 Tax=Venturia effusa TaxID=50376 RepID=A0A517LCE6_9PEZI|nr:hypothetical protein FKW77_006024 [Venturia effusa]